MHVNGKIIGPDGREMRSRSLGMDDPIGLNNRSPTSADARVGVRIKELRRAAGRTQKQIAAQIGVTGAQFHRYETGATRVAASRLMAIAAALGTRPEALMGMPAPALVAAIPLEGGATDDLVELVEAYGAISDPRRRLALITFARAVARGAGPEDAIAAE
ncbi:helix-turn-helix domain-containing protein [Roseococcus sp. SYP-B2431]|uniref:helix-turn-helix domain-containing protein n=1 Tax=Roseococcus sp. SYP-B2431 TaxID=2496640 RepID=UPI0013F3EF6A|nr:helix-turn-helix transcriptional regulator [Roseococcus sp. SYP-B2431]